MFRTLFFVRIIITIIHRVSSRQIRLLPLVPSYFPSAVYLSNHITSIHITFHYPETFFSRIDFVAYIVGLCGLCPRIRFFLMSNDFFFDTMFTSHNSYIVFGGLRSNFFGRFYNGKP